MGEETSLQENPLANSIERVEKIIDLDTIHIRSPYQQAKEQQPTLFNPRNP